jgi:hypothetical protein
VSGATDAVLLQFARTPLAVGLAGRLHENEGSGKDARVGAVSAPDHALNLITRDQLDFHPLVILVDSKMTF